MTLSPLRNVARGLVAGILALLLVLSGCDAFSNDRDVAGRVRVLLTADRLDDLAAANVTILRVELLGFDGSGESTLFLLADTPQEFNLQELRSGVTAPLAEADIPAGRYNQIRVIVHEDARVQMIDGEPDVLKVPSGTQTGIKVVFPEFEISSNDDVVTLTVDFDLEDSFVRTGADGMYVFKPVVRAFAMLVNGDEQSIATTE